MVPSSELRAMALTIVSRRADWPTMRDVNEGVLVFSGACTDISQSTAFSWTSPNVPNKRRYIRARICPVGVVITSLHSDATTRVR